MPSPEIVVTGMGVWSAAGTTPSLLVESARCGRTRSTLETCRELTLPVCRAPEPPRTLAFPQARRMDLSARLALAAAAPAWEQARLSELDPTRVAVVVGNSRGPAEQWATHPPGRCRPTRAAHSAIAALSGALSLAFHLRGPCLTVSATCASSAHAIGLGALFLQAGLADAVLAGGAEAPLVPELLVQFHAAGIIGEHPDPSLICRPFDRDRNGTLPGEGAGFLVLEARAQADRRGVPALARLAGFGLGAESHNRVAARADGEGLMLAMRQALTMADLSPGDIGHINAHGTGTRMNDTAEAAALRGFFGAHLAHIAVSSTKAVTGHAFGAAAALEAILAIEALRGQRAPPTTGCVLPDPALALEVVIGREQPLATRYVMSNSLGFWGNTASLIFAATDSP